MPDPVTSYAALFESIYAAANDTLGQVPWDRHAAHPELERWLAEEDVTPAGRSALIVGCGLGDDAERVAETGYVTTGFDVSPSAIEAAGKRFPDSSVNYQVADLLDLPEEWERAFDLVVEIRTVQAMPMHLRAQVIAAISKLVAPGGTLLVIANARPDHEVIPSGPPWPLSGEELDLFASAGLEEVSRELQPLDSRTWTAIFQAPAG